MYVTQYPRDNHTSFHSIWGLRESHPSSPNNAVVEHLRDNELANWWHERKKRPRTEEYPISKGDRLRIVHVNDTHHFHLGTRPTHALDSDDDSAEPPIHALAAYLAEARRESHDSETDFLYLSAGDEHTGTSLDELLGYESEAFHDSTGYSLQSVLGLDAATIGNHDLDRGPRTLQTAIERSADFPVLSANITESQYLSDFDAALIGETYRGISIGIIGVTTNEQLDVRPALDPLFTVEDPIQAALLWYDRIAPLVDIVVVLSHLGINIPGSRHQSESDDRKLAGVLAESSISNEATTLIIGGHTHTVIDSATEPIEIGGIPIFQAGCNMEYLGDIEINLHQRTTEGRLEKLRDRLSHSRSVPKVIKEQLQQTIEPTLHELKRAVLAPVVTFDRANNADVLTTLTDRLSGECALANVITDAIHTWFGPSHTEGVIVACDASGIQSGLVEGNLKDQLIRIDDLYRILPYADSIYRAVLSPLDVIAILKSNSLRRLHHESLESNGGDIGLMDWAKISRGFLHFSGNLRYRIISVPSGTETGTDSLNGAKSTAVDIFLNDKPIEAFSQDHKIVMYCNSFSANGNQGWSPKDEESFHDFGSVSLPDFGFEDVGEPFRTALIASLKQLTTVSIGRDQRIRI